MYGSIMRARIKDGQREAFEKAMMDETPSGDTGFHCAEVAYEDSDPNRIVMIIHFRDRDSYVANSNAPETDEGYQKMVGFFDGPPEWIDVNYVAYMGQPLSEKTATTAG